MILLMRSLARLLQVVVFCIFCVTVDIAVVYLCCALFVGGAGLRLMVVTMTRKQAGTPTVPA